MQRYRILCVGRRANDPLLDSLEDYLTRLKRYARVELVRVREGQRESEGRALLNRVGPSDALLALDERGAGWSTVQLRDEVARFAQAGRLVAWAIGGADGLSDSVKQRANATVSLSAMTLPHRLAQVLLAEQLYRAHSMLAGAPYHRG